MKKTNDFQFKQFFISQQRAAMKVNTDGVLLAAWADMNGAQNILDIGTGTGVIALIAAQRNMDASVWAIDIEEGAFLDAKSNAENSPFSSRIHVVLDDVLMYINSNQGKFDHIISNPPYFNNSTKATTQSKNLARHTAGLSHEQLLQCVSKLLNTNGKFSLIIPVEEGRAMLEKAEEYNLFLLRKCSVEIRRGKVGRLLLTLTNHKVAKIKEETFVIRELDGSYSQEHIDLTKNYYLDKD